jgi:DNA processing protein
MSTRRKTKSCIEAIAEQGLLISERAPSFSPRGKDFPRRNRLISGISLGVVVVEAAERSGSRSRRGLPAEQGREVFAVPGQPARSAGGRNQQSPEAGRMPRDKRARHCRDLGPDPGPACPASAVELAASDRERTPEALPDIHADERELIVGVLGPSPIDIDELIRATRVPARKVHIVLLELDLAGRLQRHRRQLVSLTEA